MRTLTLLALMATLSLPAVGQIQLSRLISDRMVMQRDISVPVWGWTTPGNEVTVDFADSSFTALADADSSWRVDLPPMNAGGPHQMVIRDGDEEIRVADILIGDVWIASGQSNMEWPVSDAANADVEIATADHPEIRHFKVPRSWAFEPEHKLAGGDWTAADPTNVGRFTAVGYYFARDLNERLGVPIGIINTSWGGSRIEPWMSAQALRLDRKSLEEVRAGERRREEAIRERVRERVGTLPDRDRGLVDGVAVWAAPDLDDAGWFDVPVPSQWESAGFDGMDGVGWYRTIIELSASEASNGVRLGLGMIDDSDITWVNGVEVGRMDNAWNKARIYDAPTSALRPGRNVIAVRVEDFQGGGGIAGPPETVYMEVGGERRPLPGEWKFMVGHVRIGSAGNKNQVPTVLWNKMIAPLLPFPIKGAIWYQGESNANTIEDAFQYRNLFTTMIGSWREAWEIGDFPFLWAQLAGYMATDDQPPAQSNWAVLRESQSAALRVPNTGQAVIVDIGEADDIHPRNKQDVGARLALAARKIAYGENIMSSGPTYRSHKLENGRATIAFDNIGGGLVAHGGESLGGFAVAGADGRYVWARARIEGDRVHVWSDQVIVPVAVRYGWGNNPEKANLYNAEGLPADPFRTDAQIAHEPN